MAAGIKIHDDFTDMPVSRQRKWALRQLLKDGCVICGKRAVTSHHCAKHAVAARELQRKHVGARRRNFGCFTYQLAGVAQPSTLNAQPTHVS